jgi:hypothetical protein
MMYEQFSLVLIAALDKLFCSLSAVIPDSLVPTIEYIDFDFFEKMENVDLVISANLKSKTHS